VVASTRIGVPVFCGRLPAPVFRGRPYPVRSSAALASKRGGFPVVKPAPVLSRAGLERYSTREEPDHPVKTVDRILVGKPDMSALATMNASRFFSEDKLETIVCNFCSEPQFRPLFTINGFQIAECVRCGLVYTNPRLRIEALKEVYDQSYFQSDNSLVHGYVDYAAEAPLILRTFRQRWHHLLRFHGRDKGRLLDLGCAFGYLLTIAQSDGWGVAGLDASLHAVNHAQTKLRLPVQHSDLAEIPFPDHSFDIITMWDVIEHLPDPLNVLRSCWDKLKPGGLFSIITPDSSSFSARWFGSKWVEYQKPHEHLYFFSSRRLSQVLKSMGFTMESAGTAAKHVPLGFALERLESYRPTVFKALGAAIRKLKLANTSVKVNPFDKMFLVARKMDAPDAG
jgi:2-polyprenyl-3-methyl-5-hydroxy-6-metoxy-1,4-benzoquinol methylase